MTKRVQFRYVVVILFAALFLLYYSFNFGSEFDTVFLTIATFTFAIFTGFFISRQGARQASVRDKMTELDGNLSFVYRAFGHFSKDSQKRIGDVLRQHYSGQLESKDWAFYFTKRSALLTDIHSELDKIMETEVFQKKSHAVNRIMAGLLEAQKIRKGLVALNEEKIPVAQWLLIYLLTFILLVTVSLLPSQQEILPSVLKAAFSTAVIFVLVILAQFDNLSFFERSVGEHSAQDVLDLIEGKK
jgi:hypothetical protein